MKHIKSFALQRPVLFALVAILLAGLVTEIPLQNLFASALGAQPAFYMAISLQQFLAGLAIFALLAAFGWLRAGGFTPISEWRQVWLGWPLLLFAVINGADFLTGDMTVDTSRPGLIALHLLTVLSTGWVEQVLFRGLVLTVILQKWGQTRKGIYLSVVVSSILFGCAHLLNFVMGRAPLTNTLTQVVFTLFFGIIFAASALRNNSLWPMVILHAAVDWAGTLNEIAVGGGLVTTAPPISLEGALITIGITSLLGLYGLFILRKVTAPQPEAVPALRESYT